MQCYIRYTVSTRFKAYNNVTKMLQRTAKALNLGTSLYYISIYLFDRDVCERIGISLATNAKKRIL